MLPQTSPALHIRGLGVPVGAAPAGSQRDVCLWPEIFVPALAAGYHVVTLQRTCSGSGVKHSGCFAGFPGR